MNRKIFSILLVIALCAALVGCGGGGAEAPAKEAPAAEPKALTEAAPPPADALDAIEAGYFSKRDFDSRYSEVGTPTITFNGDSAESSTNMVAIEGGIARITMEGTYIVSGNAGNGSIIVEVDKTQKVQLVLKNANIHSENSAPIYVKEADKVFVTLAEGSDNSLSNGGQFSFAEDSKIDAVIFARDDLTINGSGKLSISSPAGHGIAGNDSVSITGGSYVIDCAGNGVSANDDVTIAGGSYSIKAGKDGIRAEHDTNPDKGFVYILDGQFDIDAAGDGISAGTWLTAENGSFKLLCGGGSETVAAQGGNMRPFPPHGKAHGMQQDSGTSMKGLKAGTDINVNGGSYVIDCAEDALHADGQVCVNGGSFEISAGDDGFRSAGSTLIKGGSINVIAYGDGFDSAYLEISGGDTCVYGPARGDTSTLDYEGGAVISGGTFMGSGSAMMARTFNQSEQGLISVNVGKQSAGTEIKLTDANGVEKLSFKPVLDFCVAIISSPELVKGEPYTITVGEQSAQINAN